MSIYLSPGVYVKERDLSDIVANVASASAALVGYSAKGDVDSIRLITNSQQFIDEYGKPDPSTGHYFHQSALAFLENGNTLYCLRVENGALYGGVNIMASTSAETSAAFATGASAASFSAPSGYDTDILFQIFGVNPGVWNDRLEIKLQNIKDGTETVETDKYTFEIVVYWQDDDGNWVLVETWKVSRKNKTDGYGKQLYLEDKINGYSKYIRVADNTSIADTVVPKAQTTVIVFDGGSDGSAISSSDITTGWDEFANPDEVDIRMLINGGEGAVTVHTKMQEIAEDRADCIAILDFPYTSVDSVSSMTTFRGTTQNINSSYCALYGPWLYVYDQYNDMLVDVPPSGYIASQIAYNDYVGHPWTAPAGFRRGQLKILYPSNGVGSKFIFTEGYRDTLYAAQINPIQLFYGEGNVIWGQKTLQSKSSALSSVNVRRLMIVLEKAMAASMRSFVFEPNNEVTRFRIEAILNSYLSDLSTQGAFQTEAGDEGYRVVCDSTNNTPAVIDRNELRIDVFVKPSRAAEYIQLQATITATGASFEELIARGVQY